MMIKGVLVATTCLALSGTSALAQDKIRCFGEINTPGCETSPLRAPVMPDPVDEAPSTWNPYCVDSNGPIIGCTPAEIPPSTALPGPEKKGFVIRFLERVGDRVRGVYLQAKQVDVERRHRYE